MHAVLAVDRHLPVLRTDAAPDEQWDEIGDGALLRATVTPERYKNLLAARTSWGLAVDEDRPMSAASMSAPAFVGGAPHVEGTPMDYHGHGAAVPSLRELVPRRREAHPDEGTGEGVLIGIVDTGMRSHPWLDGGYLAAPDDFEPFGARCRQSREQPEDSEYPGVPRETGHGTFVAGLVLQQAPAAGLWIERALDQTGRGLTSAVADAATTLARRGVHVLNLSLGCFSQDAASRAVMQRLVVELRALRPDLVIVAAAGNIDGADGNPSTPHTFWPAALEEVVAVGSVDGPGARTWSKWSNRGPWVDLAAPGYRLLSTYVDGPVRTGQDGRATDYHGWARWSGTSFSAAIVSGTVARVMSQLNVSAKEAVGQLRAGNFSSGHTAKAKGVPPVPIIPPQSWRQELRPADEGPSD